MTFKFNNGAGGSFKLNSRRFPGSSISAYQPTTSGGGSGGGGLPWFNPGAYGSTLFNGNKDSFVGYSISPAFDFSGDFTVEWWQYQTDNNPFPRPFAFGAYPATKFGVSLEGAGTTFVLWGNNGVVASYPLPPTLDIKNKNIHFAIVRQSGSITVYVNGYSLFTQADGGANYDVSGTALNLGRGGPTTYDVEAFGGYISHFRISNTAIYTGTFTPSFTVPINADSSTEFLARSVGYPVEGAWTGTVSDINASPDEHSPFPPL